jgi:N-methylhydantoinase B
MGEILKRCAFSPNIKDRLDFSCAIFDVEGELFAQAAHIPVHLGSMAFAMRDVVKLFHWQPEDMIILNDPFLGGTHLPDVTMISPVFKNNTLCAFVTNRAHHADIGASSPGSMPVTQCLADEGKIIKPQHIIQQGNLNHTLYTELTSLMRSKQQSEGDLLAQISANKTGVERLLALVDDLSHFQQAIISLNTYAERVARQTLIKIPDGEYTFTDYMDNDGFGQNNLPIKVSVNILKGNINVDFDGTTVQTKGNINCPLSVAAAGVYYVFRCLMPDFTPACAGTFKAISITAPKGCLVNALSPVAVAAGNVETSMRIVDAVMGAMALVLPEQIPAASQGTMNNVAMGNKQWDYYETLGGGTGASQTASGIDAVQSHMTNTLNTPIESLEMHYPLRIKKYAINQKSGGAGKHHGGNGLIREYEFLEDTEVTLLTERRLTQPWGAQNGQAGVSGENLLNGHLLNAKQAIQCKIGDVLTIKTPGGGGWGANLGEKT